MTFVSDRGETAQTMSAEEALSGRPIRSLMLAVRKPVAGIDRQPYTLSGAAGRYSGGRRTGVAVLGSYLILDVTNELPPLSSDDLRNRVEVELLAKNNAPVFWRVLFEASDELMVDGDQQHYVVNRQTGIDRLVNAREGLATIDRIVAEFFDAWTSFVVGLRSDNLILRGDLLEEGLTDAERIGPSSDEVAISISDIKAMIARNTERAMAGTPTGEFSPASAWATLLSGEHVATPDRQSAWPPVGVAEGLWSWPVGYRPPPPSPPANPPPPSRIPPPSANPPPPTAPSGTTVGAAAEPSPLAPGEQVEHRTFGRGVVISSTGSGEDEQAEINFDDGGTKVLQVAWAPLIRLEN